MSSLTRGLLDGGGSADGGRGLPPAVGGRGLPDPPGPTRPAAAARLEKRRPPLPPSELGALASPRAGGVLSRASPFAPRCMAESPRRATPACMPTVAAATESSGLGAELTEWSDKMRSLLGRGLRVEAFHSRPLLPLLPKPTDATCLAGDGFASSLARLATALSHRRESFCSPSFVSPACFPAGECAQLLRAVRSMLFSLAGLHGRDDGGLATHLWA